MGRLRDLTGQTFGRLTVIERVANRSSSGGNSIVQWFCDCICQYTAIIAGYAIISGRTQSCGCLYREIRFSSDITNHS